MGSAKPLDKSDFIRYYQIINFEGGISVSKMSNRHKVMAYVLYKEFGYRQSAIAQLMQVAQSTIANYEKEVSFRLKIQNLEKELQEARYQLKQQGLLPEMPTLYIE